MTLLSSHLALNGVSILIPSLPPQGLDDILEDRVERLEELEGWRKTVKCCLLDMAA